MKKKPSWTKKGPGRRHNNLTAKQVLAKLMEKLNATKF